MNNMNGDKNPAYSHGHNMRGKRTDEYKTWIGIRRRCLSKTDKLYPYYGGRGIKICDKWRNSFAAFLEDMGKKPGKDYSIDRINNAHGYEFSNCRWATRTEQSRNRRNNIMVSISGTRMCLSAFCVLHGLIYKKVWRRLKVDGLTIEGATEIKGVSLGKKK